MRPHAIAAFAVLLLPGSAGAQVVQAPVAATAQNPAVAGISAAAGTVRAQSGMTLFHGELITRTFQSMLQPPLAKAFAIAEGYKTQVIHNAKAFLRSDADVFAYRPTSEVMEAARRLGMPESARKAYADNLIGKKRFYGRFQAAESAQLPGSGAAIDAEALKKELDAGAASVRDQLETGAGKLAALRLTDAAGALSSRAASASFDGAK